MKNKNISYLLPLAISMLSCRLDRAGDVQTDLPGKYGRYAELETARVWDTLDIKEKLGPGDDYPVTQTVKIQYKRGGKLLPANTESRRLTGRYNKSTGELYLVERGKSYRVNLGKQLLFDQSDTLRRARVRMR